MILHEYGHFLVAKRNGVEVDEFGLGFPPRIIGRTFGKGIFRSLYTINLLPLGGFVRLRGENDTAEGEHTYGASSLRIKTKIILAGVAVNLGIAVLLFTVLSLVGIPRLLPVDGVTEEQQFSFSSDTKIIDSRAVTSFVAEDSPAAEAGVEAGDQIVSLDGLAIENSQQLLESTKFYAGQHVAVAITRNNQDLTLTIPFRSEAEVDESQKAREACLGQMAQATSPCPTPKGYLGVATTDFVMQRHTWSAPIVGVALAGQYTKVTLQGIWRAVSSVFAGDAAKASESVAGPIGIFFVLKEGAEYGVRFVLMIIALISLTLAIMNTLPIPALDGGRLMLTVLYRKVLRRPLTKQVEERIVGSSMIALLSLMVLISIADVKRFF